MNHAVVEYAVHDPSLTPNPPKILCIDDDPDISFAIEQHLRRFELHVIRSFHGMHGFTLAVRELPAVIIMDLAMPQGDGVTILEWLRRNQQTARIPAIVLTGMRRSEAGPEVVRVRRRPVLEETRAVRRAGARNQPIRRCTQATALGRSEHSFCLEAVMIDRLVNLLVIEDNPKHLDQLRQCLGRSGIQNSLQSVDTLTEGLTLLCTSHFDVILSDLSLSDRRWPGHDRLHPRRGADGAADRRDVAGRRGSCRRSMDHGAQDYIVKDVAGLSWLRLRQVIHFAVQRQLMINETQGLLSQVQDARSQLERKNRRLSRLYHMAQDFVDHASHEFRTPLSIIKEYAAVVRDGTLGKVNPEQWRLLNVIDDRSDDLNTMVDDLLDVSKLKSGLLTACANPVR